MGEAFAEVVAETDGFEDDLQHALERAVEEASKSKNFRPIVEAAGQAGEDASEEFSRRFTLDARGRLHDERGRFVSLFSGTFGQIAFTVGRGFFDNFLAGFASAAKGAPIVSGLLSGGSQLLSVFGALGLPGLLGGLAALLPILGVLVVVVPLLVSAIFALGGALVSLVGVLGILPGLITGLLVTIAPLVIAFQGLGDAVGALVSGDLDKFNEQLKKLTPSARFVVRELQALLPFFTQLRKDVQESFFSQLRGSLTALFTAIGPALSGGLQNVAFALGGLFDLLAKFAAQPATVDFLARLFQAVATGIDANGPVIIRFLEAMVAIADASLPIITLFLGELGAGLDRFSKFLKDSAANGSFQTGLQSGLDTLKSIAGVVGELFGLLKDMFLETDESGRQFLDDVGEAISRLRDFFQSSEGKEFIQNMIVLAEDFGDILIFISEVLADIIGLFAKMIELFDDIGEGFEKVGRFRKMFPGVGSGPAGVIASLFLPKFARGGITSGLSLAGEKGAEAILPLDDPIRARQVAADPRVAEIIGGGDTIIYAVLDGELFEMRIVRTVKGQNSKTARDLSQRPRGI